MEKKTANVISSDTAKNMSTRLFQESAKKQKKNITKLLLDGLDHLQPKWSTLPNGTSEKISDVLVEYFGSFEYEPLTNKEKHLMQKKNATPEEIFSREALKLRQQILQDIKKNVVFGINEVTKKLERNDLALVIADRSVKPFSLISHLPLLAKSHAISAVAVDSLAKNLGSMLGMGSLMALGFRKVASVGEVMTKLKPWIPDSGECRTKSIGVEIVLDTPSAQEESTPDDRAGLPSSQRNSGAGDRNSVGQVEPSVVLSPQMLDRDGVYLPLVVKPLSKNEKRRQKGSAAKRKKPGKDLCEPTKKLKLK